MINSILVLISSWIIIIIKYSGYFGVFLLMTVESLNVPIPSEITMSFAGFLVSTGVFSFWVLVIIGTFGNLVGSLMSYFLASFIIKNRKRYKILKIFISDIFLHKSEEWFKKYGLLSVGFSRVLPIIRTFISLPAGLGKMNLWKFSVYTSLGSFVWSFALVYFGMVLGNNWEYISRYTKILDYVVVVMFLLMFFVWVYFNLTKKNENKKRVDM